MLLCGVPRDKAWQFPFRIIVGNLFISQAFIKYQLCARALVSKPDTVPGLLSSSLGRGRGRWTLYRQLQSLLLGLKLGEPSGGSNMDGFLEVEVLPEQCQSQPDAKWVKGTAWHKALEGEDRQEEPS